MQHPSGIFSLWLLVTGLISSIHAQDTSPLPKLDTDQKLTLELALSLALDNPVLDALAESSLRAAEARLDAIGLLPNPELRMTYDDRWTGETGQEYALRFSPPNPWLNKALRDEGQLGIHLARVQSDGFIWSATFETRKAFFEALHTKRVMILVEREEQTARKKKKLYETLLDKGQATLPDVLEVRLQYLEVDERLESSRRRIENTMNRLLARIGLADKSDRQLAGDFETPSLNIEKLKTEELFLKYAVDHHLIGTIQLQADIVGKRANQARARNRLWFNFIQAGYSENSNWWEDEDWRFRAGINIPIFDLQGRSETAQIAERDKLAAQTEFLRQQTRINLAEALANLKSAAYSLREAKEISNSTAEEVRKALSEDATAPELILPPQTRLRLEEGLHRIETARLANSYRYQQAVLAIEDILGERMEVVLNNQNR